MHCAHSPTRGFTKQVLKTKEFHFTEFPLKSQETRERWKLERKNQHCPTKESKTLRSAPYTEDTLSSSLPDASIHATEHEH